MLGGENLIYIISYELYSILLCKYHENRTDFINKEYLLNYFIVYDEINDKYIFIDNTEFQWKIIEFNTILDCFNYLIKINLSSYAIKECIRNRVNLYKWITSFIFTQENFLYKYQKNAKYLKKITF